MNELVLLMEDRLALAKVQIAAVDRCEEARGSASYDTDSLHLDEWIEDTRLNFEMTETFNEVGELESEAVDEAALERLRQAHRSAVEIVRRDQRC